MLFIGYFFVFLLFNKVKKQANNTINQETFFVFQFVLLIKIQFVNKNYRLIIHTLLPMKFPELFPKVQFRPEMVKSTNKNEFFTIKRHHKRMKSSICQSESFEIHSLQKR